MTREITKEETWQDCHDSALGFENDRDARDHQGGGALRVSVRRQGPPRKE